MGPIRQEKVTFSVKIRDKDILVDRLYDPQNQLERLAKSFMDKKLSVLALQLQMKGAGEEETERLLKKLVSLEKFSLIDLSRFLDLVCRHTGNFHDPVFVIEAIADNVARFQPDSDHAVIMAGVLAQDFAALTDPKKEKEFAAALKGN
jgi:hypothetical protein